MENPFSTVENALPRRHEKLTDYRVSYLHHLPKSDFGDWLFAMILFWRWHGRWPKRAGGTISDAMFRLKTSAEITHPLRVYVSDKEYVKDYVRSRLGDQFNVPTLACLHSLAEAERYAFPRRCVIKPTHLSGAAILRRQGEPVDCGLLKKWLGLNFYNYARERNYKTLVPKLIVEPFVFDRDSPGDYRVFCQNGEPRLIQVNIDTPEAKLRSFYDSAWTFQPIGMKNKTSNPQPPPANLDLMLHVARSLSRDFSFIRVDLYSDGRDVKVGELTNCPYNAWFRFASRESEMLASQMVLGGE